MSNLTPVAPAVTHRTLSLLEDARSALGQALYEGQHSRRQDPAPMHGSPWDTPDLPANVLEALRLAQDAISAATEVARKAAAANPSLARTR